MTRTLRIAALGLLIVLAGGQAAWAGKYYAPAGQGSAAFQITGEGAKTIAGGFTEAAGAFSYDKAGGSISDVRIAIDARSLTAAKSSQSPLLQEMFNPYLHSEIALSAAGPTTVKDGAAEANGTLTYRTQSRPVTLKMLLSGGSGGSGQTATVTFGFKRADFGLESEGEGEEDAPKIGDTVTLTVTLSAIAM